MSELRPVVVFPRDAVLELSHLAAMLGASEEIAAKMDLPFFMVGKRQRFLCGQVLEVLAQRALPTNETKLRRAI